MVRVTGGTEDAIETLSNTIQQQYTDITLYCDSSFRDYPRCRSAYSLNKPDR